MVASLICTWDVLKQWYINSCEHSLFFAFCKMGVAFVSNEYKMGSPNSNQHAFPTAHPFGFPPQNLHCQLLTLNKLFFFASPSLISVFLSLRQL